MNRQSQQLVVASVVAFLTSGVITLAGLSAAEEMQHMDGGSTYQAPATNTTSYPSHETYAAPTNTYQAPATNTTSYPSHETYAAPTNTYQAPATNTNTAFPTTSTQQDRSDVSGGIQWDGKTFFQKDGTDFQMHGKDYKKDGAGFHRGAGAPDFGEKAGAGRSFRDGFGDKEGAEHSGWRFDRKGGFDHEPTDEERNAFEGGNEETRKGMMKQYGGEHGVGVGGGQFDMSQFDQFVPKKSNANVDSLLDSLPTGDSDAAPTLTAAQESKVEKTLDKADAAGEKAVSGLQKIFDKKPTKSAATKATNYILTLVKQWVSVEKLSNGLGDYDSDVVTHADESAASFADTISEACDAASDFFDGKWKGEKVCDKVEEQINAPAGADEEGN